MARHHGLSHWLHINGAIYHAKPRRKLHWRVKEYLIWAVLIFVAILAWWGFKP